MKKIAAAILGLILISAAFSGCNKSEASSQTQLDTGMSIMPAADTPDTDYPNKVISPPQTTTKSTAERQDENLLSADVDSAAGKGLGVLAAEDYEASLVQTHDYTDALEFPYIAVIKSQEELETYLSENAEFIGYYNEITPDDITGSTADFFDESFLVIVIMEEASGSISLSFEGAEWADDTLSIDITRNVPEMGTCDMAQWQLFLTLPAEYSDKVTTENIKLC